MGVECLDPIPSQLKLRLRKWQVVPNRRLPSQGLVVDAAAINAFSTTGYAVSFTALTLIAGVVMWIFLSDLRFQSDAAVLLSFMLIVNAVAAMLIVPAWCVVFKPRFVTAETPDRDDKTPAALQPA